jgi:hypothetical protein
MKAAERPVNYRVSVRLWVMLSLAMAVVATSSTLALLYLQRPFLASAEAWTPSCRLCSSPPLWLRVSPRRWSASASAWC